MRRYIITLLLALAVLSAAAQPDSLDTLGQLPQDYLVPYHYTDCSSFDSDTVRFHPYVHLTMNIGDLTNSIIAQEYRTSAPLYIYGMAAAVSIDTAIFSTYGPCEHDYRLPEYLMLMQGTTPHEVYIEGDSTLGTYDDFLFPHQMVPLDTVRWDTVTPRLLRLPLRNIAPGTGTDTDYASCHLYEVRFPEPILVDSVFYIIGTFNSNNVTPSFNLTHRPTAYFTLREYPSDVCEKCMPGVTLGQWMNMFGDVTAISEWVLRNYHIYLTTPFFPILGEE